MLALAVFLPRTLLASQACLTGDFSALPAVHVDTTGHTDSIAPNSFDGGASLYSGTFDIQIDGGPVTQAYCVDLVHNITSNDCVPQVAPPTYSNPCEVTYILNTFFPTGSNPGPQSDDVEAAAVQAAIWFYTDDFHVDAPADVVSRAQTIINAALGQCGSVTPVPNTITVTPATATNSLNYVDPTQDTHTVTVTLLDTNSQPMANYPITIAVTGPSGAQTFPETTDGLGQVTLTYTNITHTTGTDTITATATFTVPAGLEYKDDTHQGIVLAGTPQTGSVTGSAQKIWIVPTCGDGTVNQATEQCDDGNQVNGDGCDTNCTPSGCGNGIVDPGEVCDDGNTVNGDGCDSNCTPPGCGNGVVDAGEQCDDGNTVNGDGCDANCTLPGCGNGIVDAGEACDDGNTNSCDGCSATCQLERCGNGVVDCGEQCDDGNTVNGDGCEHDCRLPTCGNGILDAGETCDDGGANGNNAHCKSNCQLNVCGDGFTRTGVEQCDDGNQNNNDACKNDCEINVCGDGVVYTGVEQCDNGALNGTPGNACGTDCKLHEICDNQVDDNGNGLIDCEDPECPVCPPITKDPAILSFRPNGLDTLKIQGGMTIPNGGTINPLQARLGFLFDNPNTVLLRQLLPPGSLAGGGNSFKYRNTAAKTNGGIYILQLKLKQGIYHVLVRAYGHLQAATVPTMGVQIIFGDTVFATKATWMKTTHGWKFELPKPSRR